jgi:hypothetical protein
MANRSQRGRSQSAVSPSAASNAHPPTVRRPEPVAPAEARRRAHHIVDRSTDNWDENGDYIVGNRRPPKAHQWKKGQSGNPAGPKPREELTPQGRLQKSILEPFTIKANGEDVTTNLGDFSLNLLKTNAAKGNRQAQVMLLQLYMSELRASAATAGDDAPVFEEREQEMLEALLKSAGLEPDPVVRKARSSEIEGGEA